MSRLNLLLEANEKVEDERTVCAREYAKKLQDEWCPLPQSITCETCVLTTKQSLKEKAKCLK